MTKRNQEIDVDAGAELATAAQFTFVGSPLHIDRPDTPLQRLTLSGIITAAEGAISWRIGHLEHVARLYVSDPRLAWRDYADDLTVALSADGGTFAALVEQARGEAE